MSDINTTAQAIFDGAWAPLTQGGKTPKFPAKFIMFGGAPGAGKGTHWKTVAEFFGIVQEPVVMSSLLKSPEMKAVIDSGKLVDDNSVTQILFAELCKPQYAAGAILDGYPRTPVQAEIIRLLDAKIKATGGKTSFGAVILMVNRETSVARQTGRAAEDQAAGKPVRATDLDPVKTGERFDIFVRDTVGALNIISQHYPNTTVDGSGKEKATVHVELKIAISKAFGSL